MGNTVGQVVTIFTAIVGVAALAVLVSRNSQTPAVVSSAFDGFASSLRAAVSPVAGGGAYGSVQF